MIGISWNRLVDLARQIDRDFEAHGAVDLDIALRLARGIVTFQEQLVGRFLGTMRRP